MTRWFLTIRHQTNKGAERTLHVGDIQQMVQDAVPDDHSAGHSPAAERMRRHRERRRDGLRCLMIELRETEIDALARNGFLKTDARNDPYSIQMALYEFLERTLA